ncbi:MAG: glycoside hydrolase family 15 protein [Dongiaceae bacterium]
MADRNLELGVIGNCAISALIDPLGSIVWSCFPRLDGDPIFCSLLRDDGHDGAFTVEMNDVASSSQRYLDNTAILETLVTDSGGNTIEITDYCPRFLRYGRMFRPPVIMRRIRPISGRPIITVRIKPRMANGALVPEITRGSNHMRFVGPRQVIRVTTNAAISYLLEERSFRLGDDLWFVLGPDESVPEDVRDVGRNHLEATLDWWHNWVRGCSIPFEWQEAVVRAAITLKLCNFEETGAIVAALTTSIPEAPNTVRNWDYRYCWIRDSFFVIRVLNALGVTRTMEDYIRFITDIVDDARDGNIQPVFGISRESNLEETIGEDLAGYRGMGPVRIGNQAYVQVQNDVYGALVLACTHVFFDKRLTRQSANMSLFEQLEAIGRRAEALFDQPDAGPWELRNSAAVHTFSSIMSWAACDRLAKIAAALGRHDRVDRWRAAAERLRDTILQRAWSEKRNALVSTFDGHDLDASMLLVEPLGFLKADDPRYRMTVEAIGAELKHGDFLFRYVVADDFGRPETAFTICTFWYIDALVALGRREEARALFETMLARRNRHGLLSEDIAMATGELWGNYPQTYSLVGLINSAIKLSMSWEVAS